AESIIDADKTPDERFPYVITESQRALPGYATLDDDHFEEIDNLKKEIARYLSDRDRRRPLNTLMLATPGSGKSYFIKQLARSLAHDRVEAITFNMATMQSPDDLAQPVDAVRTAKVNDNAALLFLDEFDSNAANYATLLPLLWDGELRT